MARFCSNWRLKPLKETSGCVWGSPFDLPIGSMAQCKSFDVTINVNAETENYMKVGQRLAEICSKFVFQKERTGTGFEHCQVRLRSRHRYI